MSTGTMATGATTSGMTMSGIIKSGVMTSGAISGRVMTSSSSGRSRERRHSEVEVKGQLDGVSSRDGRFGSEVGQIGPKWDKSGAFSDQISVHLAQGR